MSINRGKFKQAIHSENYDKSKGGKIQSKLLILTIIVILILSPLVYIVFKNSNIVAVRKEGIAMSSSEEKPSRPTTDDNVFVHVDSTESAGNDREAPSEIRSESFTGTWLGEIKEDGDSFEMELHLLYQEGRFVGDMRILSETGTILDKGIFYFPLLQIKQTGALLTFVVPFGGPIIEESCKEDAFKFTLRLAGSRLSGSAYEFREISKNYPVVFTRQRNEQLNVPLIIEWQVGSLAALFLGMKFQEVPPSLEGDWRKHTSMPFDNFEDVNDRSNFYQFFIDKDHSFVLVSLKYEFDFYDIPITSPVLMFTVKNKLHVLDALANITRSERNIDNIDWGSERVQSVMRDFVRKQEAAALNSTLNSIFLIPSNSNGTNKYDILRKKLGEPLKIQRSQDVPFPLIDQGKRFSFVYLSYKSYEWQTDKVRLVLFESMENFRVINSYLILSKDKAIIPNKVPEQFKKKKGVLSPEILLKTVDLMERKNWQVGSGWLRDQLGPPMSDMTPENLPYWWPDAWNPSINNFVYLIDFGITFRIINFRFDSRGFLLKTLIYPVTEEGRLF